MDRVRARRPTTDERRQLHPLKRLRTNQVNSCHARIVLLSQGGVCNREIAQRLGLTRQWVRKILHRFNTDRILGILWYPEVCGGWARPRVFLAEIREQVAEAALSPPQQRIGLAQWSLAKLREYLIERGVVRSISLEWLRQLLRGLGIR